MSGIQQGLLERDAEIKTISRQLDGACAGNGSLLVVEGPAGIGKTMLLRQAMEMGKERGMTVVYGRGGVPVQQIAYGVVRQMTAKALKGNAGANGIVSPLTATGTTVNLPNDVQTETGQLEDHRGTGCRLSRSQLAARRESSISNRESGLSSSSPNNSRSLARR